MIKLGVVGLGVGKAFFDVVARVDGVELAALCDLDADKLAAVAKEQGVADTYTSYDDLLASEVDAVALCTPIQVHGAQSIAAFEAGKHVLCQYIAAMDPEEAQALIRAHEASGRAYMFIETDCYERKNQVMKALAERGVFGELTMGRGYYLHDCREMGRHPGGSLTWRGELWLEQPGGRVAAVHTSVPLLELFGERVAEVYAYGPGARTTEWRHFDSLTTVGKLPSGRVLEFVEAPLACRPHLMGYCVQGTQGCFEIDRASFGGGEKLKEWKDLAALEAEFGLGDLIEDSGGHRSAWAGILRAFVHAIETGTPPPQGLYDALHVTAIGWAANESVVSGRPVKVMQFD